MLVKGLVSIITPAYNAEQFINFAIDSVRSQEYKFWELLIIDDCSSDNTFLICYDQSQLDPRIKILKTEKSSGNPSIPRNKGIETAKGEFIAFLDADDVWLPQKLSIQIKFMTEHNHSFSYTSYGFMNEDGVMIKKVHNAPKSINYSQLIKTCDIGCLTVVYNANMIGKHYFIPEKCQEDYIYWLKIVKEFGSAYGIAQFLAIYRISKNSYSRNKLKVARRTWDVYRKYENMSFVKSFWSFFVYLFFWLKKNFLSSET